MAQNKEKSNDSAKKADTVAPTSAQSASAVKSPVALREEEILGFWKARQIFEKSLKQTEGGKEFVFYDGPPFATGTPHYGHILPGTMKDVIPRFQTMRGKHVRRQWGWDCHGLPIENLIEKELGLKSKKDIEDLGIQKFNDAARASVMRYDKEWKEIIPRTGRFVDMEHDYKTMDTSYTESVWWSFKTMYDKGLAYEGFKSMHICPRCETTLSNFEINQGYKDITDISVYAKFELTGELGTFLLAWTTTPWTLPGNVALAVNPTVDYVKISVANQDGTKTLLILAKSRLSVIKDKYEIVSEFKGETLVGKSYKALFDYYLTHHKIENKERGWKVYSAGFVTTEDGTGIVHIAPAFGADDLELGQKEKLPFIQHVGIDGKFKADVKDFAGLPVKPKADDADPQGHQKTDIEIIKYLAHKGLLFAKEKIVHSYPHCWRCDTPLLNYATSSWFIRVTALKDKLIKANGKVNWTPASIKEGRFGKWLEGVKDWAVSRSRYWGAPIPVWKCSTCERQEVFGSIADLKAKLTPRNEYYVMRHGQSECNVMGIIGNDPKAHNLTEAGRKHAYETAQKLKGKGIELIFVSPFLRTKQTADIVAKELGLNKSHVIIEPMLHEVNTGSFAGKPVAVCHNYFSSYEERFTKRPPGGENQNDVRIRMGDFLYSLDKKYEGKKILIVTHDTPAWLLFSAANGLNQKETMALHDNDGSFINPADERDLKFVAFPHNNLYEADVHRPGIDAVVYSCGEKGCKGTMKRVPEVFDTWYDSGSMPYAQYHYPFENLDVFNPKSFGFLKKSKGFPADFIAEGLDQTRGWFYTLLVLSVALFGKAPYKNVLVNGLILAEDGKKMSKRLKNYPEVSEVVNKYGADAMRYFLMSSPAVHAEDVNFTEKGVDEVYKKMVLRLQNVVSFWAMYGYADGKKVAEDYAVQALKSRNVLDQWIVARLAEVVTEVTNRLESYEIDKASWPLEGFIDDLSTWYLRRSRDRFKGEDEADKLSALAVTRYVLAEFAKVMAPIMPFTAEDVFLSVRAESQGESVHLEQWPKLPRIANASEVLLQMKDVRNMVSLGLEARSKANIKVRQPLQKLTIKNASFSGSPALIALVQDEVNVKEVVFDSTLENQVMLDTNLSEELKEEGLVREFVRSIQDLRKKEKLNPSDEVILVVDGDKTVQQLLHKHEAFLKKTTGLTQIRFASLTTDEIKLDALAVKFSIER